MARLRRAVAYRKLERPYTRFSKYKALSYVRSRPHNKIARYDTGDPTHQFPFFCHLVSKANLQIRDSAIESARQTSNRLMEKVLGKSGYSFKVRMFPHHILRENPLAGVAQADRVSTGMAHSFGKTIGVAAQIKIGKIMFTIGVDKQNLPLARQAMKRASYKLPCQCGIVCEERKLPAAAPVVPVVAVPIAV